MDVKNSLVPALDRALNILEYLASRQEAATLKQIAGDLDIPSASAFRLLKNLANRGYVKETSSGQTAYCLGYKLLQLSHACYRNLSLQETARPFLLRLADRLGQTVQLAFLQNRQVIYVDQVFSSAPLSIVAPLYTPLAVNTSASAKILLSFLSVREQEAILNQQPLTGSTPRTITDKTALLEEIQRSGRQGYGFDNEEFAPGIGCIAVPILDGDGACLAALGITGPILQYQDPGKRSAMVDALLQCSAGITARLTRLRQGNPLPAGLPLP